MIKKLLFVSLFISSLSILAAAAGEIAEAKPMKKGDAEKGAKLVGTCVACHGADGNSVVGQWPTLAGQRESYLFEQLEHIRGEERVIAVMKGLLNDYSDDDLRDVSAFYASQKTKVSQADEANLALGQQIYRAREILIQESQLALVVTDRLEKALSQHNTQCSGDKKLNM